MKLYEEFLHYHISITINIGIRAGIHISIGIFLIGNKKIEKKCCHYL